MIRKKLFVTLMFAVMLYVVVHTQPTPHVGMISLGYAQEEDIEDDLEEDIEDDLEEDIEDDLEEDIEDDLEEDIEDDLEEDIEDDLEEDIEDDLEEDNEDDLDNRLEEEVDEDRDDHVDEESDDEWDEDDLVIRHPVIDRLPVELLEDDEGFHHARGVWLILTDKKTVQSLLDMDFRILSAAYLPGLDRVLVEVVEPDDEELSAVRSLLYSVLPDADVIVDYNHAYTYEPEFVAVKPHGDAASLLNDQRRQPSVLLPLPNMPAETVKIGMIDSRIDHRHEALKNTKIIAKSFVAPHVKEPTEHGTAVASILSGQSEGYRGLLPGAEVFAASVFRQDDGIEQSALAISLVRGLDWLAQTGVDVINMSLSGPENAILQAVLEQLDRRGVVIVAAAGNNGPVGQPLYPAAYDFTVAVTAVSDKHLAFSMANRGGHIDLSAPGVNIQHASTQSAYGYSSGTSLAAPFVSAGAALALAHQKPSARNTQQVLNQLFQSAKDLGTPGRDDVYGHGLIQSPK